MRMFAPLFALAVFAILASSVFLLWETFIQLRSENPLHGRTYGDGPLADPEDPEVHHLSAS